MLKFIVGPVACGKTLELILKAHQLQTIKGKNKIKILKPSIDTRCSQKIIKSAAGLSINVTDLISPIDDIELLDLSEIEAIIVDEIQFFTVKQIEQLRRISVEKSIEIHCYGLMKDFRSKMFDSSKRLLEICDHFIQATGYCSDCINKVPNEATMSMKIQRIEGEIHPVLEGESICIGGIETYIPVCYECFYRRTFKIIK